MSPQFLLTLLCAQFIMSFGGDISSPLGPPKKRLRHRLFQEESLECPDYWLTMQDLANIARLHYGWHDVEGDDAGVRTTIKSLTQYLGRDFVSFLFTLQTKFEVVGSTNQLLATIQQNLRDIENGNRPSLTLIVNSAQVHWTTLVITRDAEANRLVAFYADSFASRY